MSNSISTELLKANGFQRLKYPDGWFWILKAHEELFIQLCDDLTNATLYDNGWVEDSLTYSEVISIIEKFKAKQYE